MIPPPRSIDRMSSPEWKRSVLFNISYETGSKEKVFRPRSTLIADELPSRMIDERKERAIRAFWSEPKMHTRIAEFFRRIFR